MESLQIMDAPGAGFRKHTRFKVPEAICIDVDINGENFIDRLRINDISESGISIQVAHNFKGCMISSVVGLVMTLPTIDGNCLIKCKGQIKHITNNYFGVTFIGLSDRHQEKLRAYIANHLLIW